MHAQCKKIGKHINTQKEQNQNIKVYKIKKHYTQIQHKKITAFNMVVTYKQPMG